MHILISLFRSNFLVVFDSGGGGGGEGWFEVAKSEVQNNVLVQRERVGVEEVHI